MNLALIILQDTFDAQLVSTLTNTGWVVIGGVAALAVLPAWWATWLCRQQRQKYWDTLLEWVSWKWAMQAWIKDYKKWVAKNCQCPSPYPEDPPTPPEWPNGGWDPEPGGGDT